MNQKAHTREIIIHIEKGNRNCEWKEKSTRFTRMIILIMKNHWFPSLPLLKIDSFRPLIAF